MTDTQADLTARARAEELIDELLDYCPSRLPSPNHELDIERVIFFMRSEREAERAEARRAAIDECEKIAAAVAEGIAGRMGYDPAALTAAEHIEANIRALALPAPQEETR